MQMHRFIWRSVLLLATLPGAAAVLVTSIQSYYDHAIAV